ncbi:MAG: FAD-dependent oxidoreductase [Myxococcales bacterium]|nr:FAD-dependent oxidoreductase [Myxococcales bacterium]
MARKARQPRIVILGGGFAGLAAALELADGFRVTLVDARASFEFLPNIHELVSGVKRPDVLRLPLDRIVRRAGHRFVRDTVTAIDTHERRVTLERRAALSYDALIVALGGVNATHGVPGVEEHAFAFKSVDDCDRIGRRIRKLLRAARRQDVVIVGGGLEGIEALGEIVRVRGGHDGLRIHLVEAGERLLGDAPSDLDRFVRELAPDGVEFLTDARVARVEDGGIVLEDGRRIPSQATIWTGGPAAPSLLAQAGLAKREGAWAPVTPTLQATGHPNVFIAGDCAELPDPIAKQAYHALDMGRWAAEGARRWLEGQTPNDFEPAEKPALVSFGNRTCFLVAGERVLAAPALAVAKEGVFELVMAQLDRRTPWQAATGAAFRLREAGFALLRNSFVSRDGLLRGTRIGGGAR